MLFIRLMHCIIQQVIFIHAYGVIPQNVNNIFNDRGFGNIYFYEIMKLGIVWLPAMPDMLTLTKQQITLSLI